MKKENSKSTLLVISTGFLLIYLVFSWQWAVIVAFATGIIGIISSQLSKKIEWLWMKLAQLLGYVVPKIILSIVFFFVLYPLSLLSKLFNNDALMLSKDYASYFIDVNKKSEKENLRKMW